MGIDEMMEMICRVCRVILCDIDMVVTGRLNHQSRVAKIS